MWTVNDVESMRRLVGMGVDGIISDLPTTLCGELRRRRRGVGRELTGPLRAQPRPQFGFLPWLAFFLVRSLRLTVRFDMERTG